MNETRRLMHCLPNVPEDLEQYQRAKVQAWVDRIGSTIGDPDFPASILHRAARALVHEGLDPEPMETLLDAMQRGLKKGSIANPGGYFNAVFKRMLQKAELPWRHS